MRRNFPLAALLFFGFPVAFAFPAAARELTFEDRVKAQEAIERIYYGHQIQATRPFDQAVPHEYLVRKVQDYMKRSAALEKIWRTPVTTAALQAELERIARNTRFPDRLLEVYGALGNDPALIRECFARPVLVDRLSRGFFDRDERIHGAARREAEGLDEQIRSGHLTARASHPRRAEIEIREGDPRETPVRAGNGGDGSNPLVVTRADYDAWRARLPSQTSESSGVVEERDSFAIRVVLDEKGDWIRLATYSIPKVSWDVWWEKAGRDLKVPDAEIVPDGGPVPLWRTHSAVSQSTAPCDPDDTWDNGTLDDYPGQMTPNSSRTSSMVWTGSLVLVWGAAGNTVLGGRYDPLTDVWQSMSSLGAPGSPQGTTAVWTGNVMLTWGWYFPTNQVTAGRYDPIADTWSPVSLINAPAGRFYHTAVWTGRVMVIWGGRDLSSLLNSGGRYDPAHDRWEPTSTSNAPDPREEHTATWTGTRMLVWGGTQFSTTGLVSGGSYDPETDTWGGIATTGAPPARQHHTAVWTGNRLIVWGGVGTSGAIDLPGGRYDPSADRWEPMATLNQPWSVGEKTAIWTGSRMLVWGGDGANSGPNPGGRYDPAGDSWEPMSTVNAPTPTIWHPAVWTGTLMVVWNGGVASGGRYDPAADMWTPVSTGSGPPYRFWHSAVWTGNVMVVWGGANNSTLALATGGRYDPVTDSWTPTTLLGAPPAEQLPTAVWTGDVMVLGSAGGRYDPVQDSWRPMSRPSFSASGTAIWPAVWTGSNMIVPAGRYDPVTDTWAPISAAGRPAGGGYFFSTAVWTGSEMVVWGSVGEPTYAISAGRYNPATDSWRSVSTQGAPAGRRNHTALWSGTRMVVWGGYNGAALNNGGRYDPVTDSWQSISTINAPSSGSYPTSVWTGTRALVWGGTGGNVGGRYDPQSDSWTPITQVGGPLYRIWHTAVWTGSFMVIWDGQGGYGTGGRYALDHSVDRDGDGYSECTGDCNDGDAAINPGAIEVCDGRDNNCDGRSDETFGDADGDLMGDACDCAPHDPSAFAIPGEIREVEWTSTPERLWWRSLAPSTGNGTVYDVVRGRAGEWPVGSGPSEACVKSDSTETTLTDVSTPATIYYYLIRGRNACGAGSYGRTSSGAEEITPACF